MMYHTVSRLLVGAFVQTVFLRKRLRRFILQLPLSLRVEVEKYVRHRKIPLLRNSKDPPPHCLLLPAWLLQQYRKTHPPRVRGFLTDVLWGQFCVYLSFRIKDDLLDNDAEGGHLVFVADLLQLESFRAFSLLFPRTSSFWDLYFESLRLTDQGIVRVDALQRTRSGNSRRLFREYANVCAIFRIGAAAVCAQFSAVKDVRNTARFWDEIAVAGQLLDDLQDLNEDWHRKRFNSVVQMMLRRDGNRSASRFSDLRSVKRELLSSGLDRVLSEVSKRIDRAEKALARIHTDVPYAGLRSHRNNIMQLQRAIHQERVRSVFSGVSGLKRQP